jgi:hypothetical protein
MTELVEYKVKDITKMNLIQLVIYKKQLLQIDKTIDILQEIEVLEKQLRANSAAKYKENHKIYCNEIITCECGIQTIRKHKSTHKKSKGHLIYEARTKV